MMTFDFLSARNKHIEWKTKLQTFFKTGQGLTSAQLTSEHDCDLGKWLYGEGLKKYTSIPEMHELEATHKTMHAAVRTAVRAKETNRMSDANAALEKVNILSQEVVHLLTAVETAVKGMPEPATH